MRTPRTLLCLATLSTLTYAPDGNAIAPPTAPDAQRGAESAERLASTFIQAAGARDEASVRALLAPASTCETAPPDQQAPCKSYLATLESGVPTVLPSIPKKAVAASVACEVLDKNPMSTLHSCTVTTQDGQPLGVTAAEMNGRYYLMFGLPTGDDDKDSHGAPPGAPSFELKTVEDKEIGCRVRVPELAEQTDSGRWVYESDPRRKNPAYSVQCHATKPMATVEDATAQYRIPKDDAAFTVETLPKQQFRFTTTPGPRGGISEVFLFGTQGEQGIRVKCTGPEAEGVRQLCSFLEVLPAKK